MAECPGSTGHEEEEGRVVERQAVGAGSLRAQQEHRQNNGKDLPHPAHAADGQGKAVTGSQRNHSLGFQPGRCHLCKSTK